LEVLRSQSWAIYAGARAKGAGARAKSRYPYAEAILDGRERKAKTTSPVEVDAAFPLQARPDTGYLVADISLACRTVPAIATPRPLDPSRR